MKALTTLVGFETKNGVGQNGPWLLSIFKDSEGGEFSTFDGGVASQAQALLNQPVEVEYEPKTNAKGYTNRTLKGIVVANGETVVGQATPAVYTQTAPQTAANTFTPAPDNKQTYIHRQSSLKAAIECFGIVGQNPIESLGELLDLADTFVDYVENGHPAATE